jgi:hypothetical protein
MKFSTPKVANAKVIIALEGKGKFIQLSVVAFGFQQSVHQKSPHQILCAVYKVYPMSIVYPRLCGFYYYTKKVR